MSLFSCDVFIFSVKGSLRALGVDTLGTVPNRAMVSIPDCDNVFLCAFTLSILGWWHQGAFACTLCKFTSPRQLPGHLGLECQSPEFLWMGNVSFLGANVGRFTCVYYDSIVREDP